MRARKRSSERIAMAFTRRTETARGGENERWNGDAVKMDLEIDRRS